VQRQRERQLAALAETIFKQLGQIISETG